MPADEYLRKAAELNEREQTLRNAHKPQADAKTVVNADLLAQQYRQVLARRLPDETVVIDFGHAKSGPNVHRIRFSDVDIIVHGVHNLPTRVACGHPLSNGHHSATEPMRHQMNSGRYPTIEDHIARSSVAFEPFIDEMGRFVAKQLTQVEEDAIRTRSSRNSVR